MSGCHVPTSISTIGNIAYCHTYSGGGCGCPCHNGLISNPKCWCTCNKIAANLTISTDPKLLKLEEDLNVLRRTFRDFFEDNKDRMVQILSKLEIFLKTERPKKPHTCPVCQGKSSQIIKCLPCDGKGIVWG